MGNIERDGHIRLHFERRRGSPARSDFLLHRCGANVVAQRAFRLLQLFHHARDDVHTGFVVECTRNCHALAVLFEADTIGDNIAHANKFLYLSGRKAQVDEERADRGYLGALFRINEMDGLAAHNATQRARFGMHVNAQPRQNRCIDPSNSCHMEKTLRIDALHHQAHLVHMRGNHDRRGRTRSLKACMNRSHNVGFDNIGALGKSAAHELGNPCFGSGYGRGFKQALQKRFIGEFSHKAPSSSGQKP